MVSLGAIGMAFGNNHDGFGFGGRYGHHMMFNNEDRGRDFGYGYGDGRGMMDWYNDTSTSNNG